MGQSRPLYAPYPTAIGRVLFVYIVIITLNPVHVNNF
ncbi:hypothetical protein VPHD378_0221 [Vibrio phage D378]